MLFRNILIITGAILAGLGVFALLANYIPMTNVPAYSYKGNVITGIILFSIGIYMIFLGIIDDPK